MSNFLTFFGHSGNGLCLHFRYVCRMNFKGLLESPVFNGFERWGGRICYSKCESRVKNVIVIHNSAQAPDYFVTKESFKKRDLTGLKKPVRSGRPLYVSLLTVNKGLNLY